MSYGLVCIAQDLWSKVEGLVNQCNTTSHKLQDLMDSYAKVKSSRRFL